MSLLAELKRRNVIRMAGLYLVTAWLLIQIAETLLPIFHTPDWVLQALVLLLALGFVPALVFAWVFELTPEGLKRDGEVAPEQSIATRTGRRMDRLIFAGLLALIAVIAADRFWPRSPPAAAAAADAAEPAAPLAAESDTLVQSLAVLPFTNLSGEAEQAYFSDGLAEEILNRLAGIHELKVAARTSAFAFRDKDVPIPEIGRTLGVAHVLEGSVRRSGDRLRIRVQLIKADDSFPLWSQSYERELRDVFAIQDEIAIAIADALRVTLVGQAAPTTDIAVYDLYLRARDLIQKRDPEGLRQAQELVAQGLAQDPDYAPLLAASAELWLHLSDGLGALGDIPQVQAWAEADTLLQRALALDPQLAEAHAVLGLLSMYTNDHAGALAHLARALEINPGLSQAQHWQAMVLSFMGRAKDSAAMRERLIGTDPLNANNLSNLRGTYTQMGDIAAAERVVQRIRGEHPDSWFGPFAQAGVEVSQGQLAAAAQTLAPSGASDRRTSGTVASVHYLLGDFETALRYGSASANTEPRVLLALGRSEEALAQARTRLDQAPRDPFAAINLLDALSRAGRHQAVLDEMQGRWGSLAALLASVPRGGGHFVLAPVAAAQRALGREDDRAATLRLWQETLVYLESHGYAYGGFQANWAAYHALAGDREAALRKLAQAIDVGYRDPLLARDPNLEPLWNNPAFRQQVERMTGLIDTERAQLDLPPLPVGAVR